MRSKVVPEGYYAKLIDAQAMSNNKRILVPQQVFVCRQFPGLCFTTGTGPGTFPGTVRHTPTGRPVCAFRDSDEAKALIGKLGPLFDWNVPGYGLPDHRFEEVAVVIEQVARVFGDVIPLPPDSLLHPPEVVSLPQVSESGRSRRKTRRPPRRVRLLIAEVLRLREAVEFATRQCQSSKLREKLREALKKNVLNEIDFRTPDNDPEDDVVDEVGNLTGKS